MYKFIRFKLPGTVWVLEPDREIKELTVNAKEIYHAKEIPHLDENLCHLEFSDGGLVRDIPRSWFEVIEDIG